MQAYLIKPGEKGIDALHVQDLAPGQPAPGEVGVLTGFEGQIN